LALPQPRKSSVSVVLFFPLELPDNLAQTASSAHTVEIGPQSWLRHLDDGVLAITAANTSYCGCDVIPDSLPDGDSRRTILERHCAWIAIDLFHSDQPQLANRAKQIAEQQITALANADAQAAYVSGKNGSGNQFLLLDEPARRAIRSGRFFQFAESQKQPSVEFIAAATSDHTALPGKQRLRELRQLADRSRVINPAGHALVRARLERGHAIEDLWLRVIRCTRSASGSETFVSEMTMNSRLWPFLKAGERVHLNYYEPLEVREIGESAGK
jgi:hypothetical protein